MHGPSLFKRPKRRETLFFFLLHPLELRETLEDEFLRDFERERERREKALREIQMG